MLRLPVRRDGDRGDARVVVQQVLVVGGERLGGLAILQVSWIRGFVAGARDDQPVVGGEVECVDFLLVAVEDVADAFFGDVRLGNKLRNVSSPRTLLD